ncbi:MAG: twin-arginine translocase TatA/TatE family subunit [Chloroflexi bacterium]|nr:twin-arginine translocase TatA/TatE family subunit [Chloroflexota bacterium]
MFGSLGSTELIVIVVLVLIVFGAGKLPSVMKDLGKGVSEFKKAQQTDGEPVVNAAGSTAAVAPAASQPPVVQPAPVAAGPVASRTVDSAPRA